MLAEHSPLRGATRLLIFTLWSFLLIPAQIIVLLFARGDAAYVIPRLWHRGMCFVYRLNVITQGAPCTERQTIFVSNHVSYLDIPVIGSVLPASFVAKAEVASWPVFGFLAKLQQSAFISRSRHTLGAEKQSLENMLKRGRSLIIFPEGTSTDGRSVLDFKSSLFSLALDQTHTKAAIQPFTLVLTGINGKDVADQLRRDMYAWHGDMTLPPHFWNFSCARSTTVKLIFHEPLDPGIFADRKALARSSYEKVLSGMPADMILANRAETH